MAVEMDGWAMYSWREASAYAAGLDGGDEVLELSQCVGRHGHLSDAGLGALGSCLSLYPRQRLGGAG